MTRILQNHKAKILKSIFLFIIFVTLLGKYGWTQNIPCTGYNADVVANGTGASASSSNATVDATASVFVTSDFNPGGGVCNTTNAWPATVTSLVAPNPFFSLQAASGNNCLRLTGSNSGTLSVTTPIACQSVYVLITSGQGGCTYSALVTFSDNSTENFTGLSLPDWTDGGGANKASGLLYRIGRNTNTNCTGGGNAAFLFQSVLNISAGNQTKPIKSITFTNGGGTNVLNVFAIAKGPTVYCIPTYSGTADNDYIKNVTIPTTTLNNTTTGASAPPLYTLFPQSGSTTATLTQGNTYTLSVTGGNSTCYIAAWIDYNNDGVFNTTNEFIGVSGNCGSQTAVNLTTSWLIPLTSETGSIRMRLRTSYNSPGPAATESCGAISGGVNWGETEDYIVTIESSVVPTIVLSTNAVAAGNVAQASTNNPIYSFAIKPTVASASLTGLKITTTGSYASADVTNLKCYYQSTSTFNAGTATLLSTFTNPGAAGSKTFPSFTSQTIAKDATGYIFITADVACASTVGRIISVNAVTGTNTIFALGTATGTPAVGNTQTISALTSVDNVTGAAASVTGGSSAISWTNPSCFDEIMIVAAAGSNSGTPSGDGTLYTANLAYGSGTALGNGFVVYKGNTSPQTVTGLTNGTEYCFKIFARKGTIWSSGVEVCVTPVLNYCIPAYSGGASNDYISRVRIPGTTLDNTSTWEPSPYYKLFPQSGGSTATIIQGNTYTLKVNGGPYADACFIAAWIDYNTDGDFDDAGEFLGVASGCGNFAEKDITTAWTIPTTSATGPVRLRLRSCSGGAPLSTHSCGATINGWGETEDYIVTIESSVVPTIVLSTNAVAAGNVAQASTNNPIYSFGIKPTVASASLTGLTVTTTGSYAAADITNLKCYYQSTSTFNAGTATLLSTYTNPGAAGSKTFPSFTSQTIAKDATGYIFITADVVCEATVGRTISVNAVTGTNTTFALGTATGTPAAGNTQTVSALTSVANVTGAAASGGSGSSIISWTNPSCFDEIMIVAAIGNNSGIPSGNGSAYTASLTYGNGTALGNGFVVYKGINSPQTVTGLTSGITYCYKIFTRKGLLWSSGVEVCVTANMFVTCTHTVELYDYAWDGWGGNTLSVVVDGTTVLSNIECPYGSGGPETFTFQAITGSLIEILFFGNGVDPSSCHFNYIDGNGTNVHRWPEDDGNIYKPIGACPMQYQMTYVSSTVTQASTADISLCSNDEQIIRLEIITEHDLTPPSLKEINLWMNGTIFDDDLYKMHVYYTGNSNVFAPTAPFDGTGTIPSSQNVVITGTQELMKGSNYFWVAFDIKPLPILLGENADIKIQAPGIKINSTYYIPTEMDPSGFREIVACNPCLNSGYLQNGGFEIPVMVDNSYGGALNSTPGVIWKTTAPNGVIEIWRGTHMYSPPGFTYYEGLQVAEINATQHAGLYQDIVTIPCTQLTWSVAHRGRTGIDTMGVFIGPPANVALQQKNGTDSTGWKVYTNTYNVPPGQTLTRFEFRSISTANGNHTEGNFIDDVQFYCTGYTVTIDSGTDTICIGDSITITASGGNSYVWSTGGTGSSITVVPVVTTTYTVTATTNAGCTSTIDVKIIPVDCTLPIELYSFDAKCVDGVPLLHWVTTSETNNDYFTLERSDNAEKWQYVARIRGAGNSNVVLNYNYLDKGATETTKYYRLTQTDFNGDFEIFNPIAVDCGKNISDIFIYPNPFNEQIVINTQNINCSQAMITLRDIIGRVVLQELVSAEDINTITINVSHLAKGIYTIEFKTGEFMKVEKIIKNY